MTPSAGRKNKKPQFQILPHNYSIVLCISLQICNLVGLSMTLLLSVVLLSYITNANHTATRVCFLHHRPNLYDLMPAVILLCLPYVNVKYSQGIYSILYNLSDVVDLIAFLYHKPKGCTYKKLSTSFSCHIQAAFVCDICSLMYQLFLGTCISTKLLHLSPFLVQP